MVADVTQVGGWLASWLAGYAGGQASKGPCMRLAHQPRGSHLLPNAIPFGRTADKYTSQHVSSATHNPPSPA